MLRHILPSSKKIAFPAIRISRLSNILIVQPIHNKICVKSGGRAGQLTFKWICWLKNEHRYNKDDWVIDQFSLKFVSFKFKWHLGVLTAEWRLVSLQCNFIYPGEICEERYTLSFSTTHSNMAAAPCITTRSGSSASFSLQVNRNTKEHQIYILLLEDLSWYLLNYHKTAAQLLQ